ncbi:MAG: DUF167 family protein [Gammaproteobacteria bacterium]|jgi:uncharacterized protein (TIGR00251 family)
MSGNFYQWQGADLILQVRAQPRSKREGFAEIVGEAVKVNLKAPPVEGKANEALVRFLAARFGVRRAQITLLSGEHARAKRLRIENPRSLPEELGLQRPATS